MIGIVLRAFVGTHVACQVEAVHARHFDIHQHDVGQGVDQLFQRVDAVLGGNHVVAGAFEQATGNLAHGQRIIDHHDGWRARRFDAGRDRRCSVRAAQFAAGKRDRVEHQDDLAVPEHRGAGDADDAGQLRAGLLQHDFLVATQRVDAQRHSLCAGTQEQNPVQPARFGHALEIAQQARQVVQRVAFVHATRLRHLAMILSSATCFSSVTCSTIDDGIA